MSESRLFVVGTTHHLAPLELRERFTLDAPRTESLYQAVRAAATEAFVLGTCNRAELYAVAPASRAEELHRLLPEALGVDPKVFASHSFQAADAAAVAHLLEVASGLDSQIIGETEILGQVKESYDDATRRGTVGPALHRLLQKAFQTAKKVRSETAVGRGQVSIGNIAVELSARIYGDISRARILVIGSGEVAEKTATSFISRGARQVTVTSRTLAHAEELAARLPAQTIRWEAHQAVLGRFDIVISGTAAPEYIVHHKVAEAAIRLRPRQPMFYVDLAMPRDVEPSVGDLPNVFRYDLEDLGAIARENLRAREAEVAEVRAGLARRATDLHNALRL